MYSIKIEIKGRINTTSEKMSFDEESRKAFYGSLYAAMEGKIPLEMKKGNKIILVGPEICKESIIEVTEDQDD